MNTAVWNQLPEVRSPAARTVADLLAEGPRRQALPGFEPVYRDLVDYIVRCTHRIWEQKDIGLCRTHYADSCVMHTLNGPICGVEKLVQGTLSALSAFADRQVVAAQATTRASSTNGTRRFSRCRKPLSKPP